MNKQPGQPLSVSALGLGCAAIGNLYAEVPEAQASATLTQAWEGGVRFFDTAPYYGHGLSEARLGGFLATLNEAQRRELTLSTKVGRTLEPVTPGSEPDCGFVAPLPNRPVFDYSADAVHRQVAASLERLGVDRFGMLLVHDVGALTHGDDHQSVLRTVLEDTLPALAELRSTGVTAAVGVGVNEIDVCLEILAAADLDVILLAGRYTLLEQRALDELLPLCQERQVNVVVGGPFNSGLLAGGDHYDYADVPAHVAERVSALRAVCEDHGVALPAAALQFPLAHPAVASVIPGARSPEEVADNLALFAQPLPAALWADLKGAELLHSDAPTPRA